MTDAIADDAKIKITCPDGCMEMEMSYRAFLRLYNVPFGLIDTDRFRCPDCLQIMGLEVVD